MIRWLLALFAAMAAILLAFSAARALDPFHVNISTGGQDTDGDHRLNAHDQQPNQYCSEAHADSSGGSGTGIDLTDVLNAAAEFDKEPPDDERADQNHNDQGDYLDVLQILVHFGGGTNDCTRTTFWPTSFGETQGDAIGLRQTPGPALSSSSCSRSRRRGRRPTRRAAGGPMCTSTSRRSTPWAART